MARNEYITDSKVLSRARRANKLFSSAQDNMGQALDFLFIMASLDPETPAWAISYMVATLSAEWAIEDTKRFQRIVGDVAINARPKDIQNLSSKVYDQLSAPQPD